MKKQKELTKAELQIMNIMWDIHKGSVNDVLSHFDEPFPAYNTVLTFLRILVEKEYLTYDSLGKKHCYYPLMSKAEYTKLYMREVKDRFFKGSTSSLLSFFVKEESLSAKEVDELIKLLKRAQ